MSLKVNLHPQLVSDCIGVLKEALKRISEVGQQTQEDSQSNSRYINIIIEINTLIRELKNVGK